MAAVNLPLCMQAPPTEEDAIAAFLLALKQKMAAKDEKRAVRPNAGRRANVQ